MSMRKKVVLTPKDGVGPRREPAITSEEFKQWRSKLEWSQRRAADFLRVSLRAYEKWEGGSRQARNPGPIRLRMKEARPRG